MKGRSIKGRGPERIVAEVDCDDDDSDDQPLPDSLELFRKAGIETRCSVGEHVYFVALLLVVVGHWKELHHPQLMLSQAGWSGSGLLFPALHLGRFVPMQAFFIVAGVVDLRLPPVLLRTLAARTAVAVGIFVWLYFYSEAPDNLSSWLSPPTEPVAVSSAGAPASLSSRQDHHVAELEAQLATFNRREMAWFAVAILLFRTLHAALASAGARWRWLLAPLGVAAHFGCAAGGGCPWPLARGPFDLRLVRPWPPVAWRLALLLPRMRSFSVLLVYYAAVPRLLPAGFPRVSPTLLGLRGAVSQGNARAMWAGVLLLLLLATSVSRGLRELLELCDQHAHKSAYACKGRNVETECSDERWSAVAAAYDVAGVLLSCVVVVGVAAVVPRSETLLAWAGRRSFQVYLLHDFVLQRLGPPLFRHVVAPTGTALHPHLVPLAVAGCGCLVVLALAALPLHAVPPLWAPWGELLAARPPQSSRGQSKSACNRARALMVLPVCLCVLWWVGGLRLSPQLRPIVRYATGQATCEEVLPVLPFRRRHSPHGCPALTRACAVWRICHLGDGPARHADTACIGALGVSRQLLEGAGTEGATAGPAEAVQAAGPVSASALSLRDRSCGVVALRRVYIHGESMASALREVAAQRSRKCGKLANATCVDDFVAWAMGDGVVWPHASCVRAAPPCVKDNVTHVHHHSPRQNATTAVGPAQRPPQSPNLRSKSAAQYHRHTSRFNLTRGM